MSRPFKLYRLQQIDSQLDRMEGRLRQIDVLLSDNSEIEHFQDILDTSSMTLNKKQKELRIAEDNLQIQKVKIEQSESSLYGGKIHNPKELQDLQNEVESLKRYQNTLEDRLLDAMQAEEDASELYEKAKSEYEDCLTRFENLISELNSEKSKLIKDHKQFKSERNAAVASIVSEDLSLYLMLREQRRGIAVAVITDKACSACGTVLNAILLHSARSPDHITRCDSCGRILYLA